MAAWFEARRRAALLLVLVLVACGQEASPPAGTPVPGAATSGPSASGGLAADPSAPIIDVEDLAGPVVAAEIAMRAEDRERARLVNLGPGSLDLAAAMDASAARVLAQARGDAPAGSLAGHLAAIGPFAPQPGFNSMLVWGTLITSLDDFAREPKSGTVEMEPETMEIAGNTGTITTTMTLKATVSGSQLSVDITVKTKGQVVDKATGGILYSIDSIASGHIDVDFCPDASGHSKAHINLTSSEIYSTGGGGAKGNSKEFSADVGITVGDDANISRVEGTNQGSDESKGGIPAAGGSDADMPATTRQASDNIANDGKGRRLADVPRDIKIGGEGSTVDDQIKLWGSMSLFTESMVMAAALEAEKLWRSGKCVELIVDPDGGDVEPDAVTTVTAKLKHKIEGNELDKPVKATFSGVKSLDPDGEEQPAPATVTHTAGSDEGDWGRIAFKSVSNRGIAEKTVTFTVRPAAWEITFKGTDTETFAIVKNNFKASISDLKVTAKDNALSGTGKLRLRGTVTSGPCSGPLDQVAPAGVTGTLVGTGDDAVLRIVIRSTSPAGGVVHMRCQPGGGADIGAEGHAERFGETLATFELPAAAGSVQVSKTANIGGIMKVAIKGTFTVVVKP